MSGGLPPKINNTEIQMNNEVDMIASQRMQSSVNSPGVHASSPGVYMTSPGVQVTSPSLQVTPQGVQVHSPSFQANSPSIQVKGVCFFVVNAYVIYKNSTR